MSPTRSPRAWAGCGRPETWSPACRCPAGCVWRQAVRRGEPRLTVRDLSDSYAMEQIRGEKGLGGSWTIPICTPASQCDDGQVPHRRAARRADQLGGALSGAGRAVASAVARPQRAPPRARGPRRQPRDRSAPAGRRRACVSTCPSRVVHRCGAASGPRQTRRRRARRPSDAEEARGSARACSYSTPSHQHGDGQPKAGRPQLRLQHAVDSASLVEAVVDRARRVFVGPRQEDGSEQTAPAMSVSMASRPSRGAGGGPLEPASGASWAPVSPSGPDLNTARSA